MFHSFSATCPVITIITDIQEGSPRESSGYGKKGFRPPPPEAKADGLKLFPLDEKDRLSFAG
jgi:hypothetical protein